MRLTYYKTEEVSDEEFLTRFKELKADETVRNVRIEEEIEE